MRHLQGGLPTQAEIDTWDSGQRARGHQMVRLKARIETVRAELEHADPDNWDWIRELIQTWDSLEDRLQKLQEENNGK